MIKSFLLLATSLFVLSACQTASPRPPFAAPANATAVQAQFKHLLVSQAGKSTRLHVYIEGDGIPFENRFQIAQDPSPTNPLMLKLMTLDGAPSLYIGRPCYFIRSLPALADTQCSPRLWTSARYSDQVINSMVDALRQQAIAHSTQGITLIGHSGGGALAMLMAARMSEVDQVVTLAGNLDIQAWANLHHYTALKESLNPADLPANKLPRKQLHFTGDRDGNIPPTLSATFLERIGQRMQIIKNADHNCCWLTHWSEILAQINQQASP